jgi:hypothetical protein
MKMEPTLLKTGINVDIQRTDGKSLYYSVGFSLLSANMCGYCIVVCLLYTAEIVTRC